MDEIEVLKVLSEELGPSGREDRVREIITQMIKGYVDEFTVDVMGNLIARKGEGKPVLMLAAHMDEVGFLVRFITEKGFLKVAALGGINVYATIGSRVAILKEEGGDIEGVLGTIPPHLLRKKDSQPKQPTIEDLFIDVGAKSRDEALEMGIKIGDYATFVQKFAMKNDIMFGKAFDDRLGCSVMVSLIKGIKDVPGTVYFVFTVQEEVGLRGAHVAANRIKPDIAIALEGTIAADIPGVSPENYITQIGEGPAIRLMDARTLANRKLVDILVNVAEERGIKYQLQISPYSGTDAGAIQFAGTGVAVTAVSVPARYIHNPLTLALKSDYLATIKLLKEAIPEILHKFR
ncbi:MAG TPA: M42 family peptidase [Thermoproteales archaeon]|nr:M42 family peptidase [Thermoproteales archaeon]